MFSLSLLKIRGLPYRKIVGIGNVMVLYEPSEFELYHVECNGQQLHDISLTSRYNLSVISPWRMLRHKYNECKTKPNFKNDIIISDDKRFREALQNKYKRYKNRTTFR